ncbi:unnamed protein product [Rhizoctonia solani]|uniref:ATP-dependent DNA helicase n=1 Tax=Rhizoctonia solani TaxID=456999 RepID=A0A8H3C066_9AGAM|nr:unnamed protein product [Rhizoctonia solani]
MTIPELVKMLEDMRIGQVSPASERLLHTLAREVEYSDGIQPVELFPLWRLADSANQRRMWMLPGTPTVYRAQDSFSESVGRGTRAVTPERGRLLLDKMAMGRMELKIGAQVMCTKNFRSINIVNGSIGKVLDFMTPAEARQSRHFIEMIPSDDPNWDPFVFDPTFPKSDREVKLYGDVPEPGSPLHDWLRSQEPDFPWPTVETEGRKWPVVQFDQGTVLLVTPTLFTSENVRGETEACRVQIPLILAWALTIELGPT